jgi:uncharacterized protein YggE
MANEEAPDLILMSTNKHGDIAADRAFLSVTIEGSSILSGESALHKAREVRALADALRQFGLEDADIELESISASTASGTFTKSSSVRYSLKICVANVAQLPDILGLITSQKNITMHGTQWAFPDQGAWRDEWLDECLDRANLRASRVARGLNVRLIGVHRFSESWSDDEPVAKARQMAGNQGDDMMMARARSLTSEDLGLSVSHSKKVSLTIAVHYLISRFENEK